MKFDLKILVPHIFAIAIFLGIALIYCKPAIEGKVLNSHDNQGWRGMIQQSFEAKEKYGRLPLWTNSMFSGMPAYQIGIEGTHKISFYYINYLFTFGLPKPVNFFFAACICFYLLCIALGIRPWIAIMGAVAYAYSTYDPVIISAGHDTKMQAIGYAPLAIAGLILLFQKRWWLGAAALTTGFVLEVSVNHLQIVYYTLLVMGVISIGFFVYCIRNKELFSFLKSICIAAVIGLIALGSNAVNTLTTWDYAKESMRGGESELKETQNRNTTKGGLDKDYAFKYSVGIGETFTFIVPGLYGGSNGGREYTTSKFADKLMEVGYPEDQALQYANGISYWGEQQPTSGPIYLGAVICVLLILAMFIEKGWLKWSLFTAGFFGVILAWGKNLEGVNYFLFDYMPFYKKFRAPSMALVMPQLTFVLLACIGLQSLLFKSYTVDILKKVFRNTSITAGVVFIVLVGMYFSFNYVSPGDKGMKEQFTSAMLQQAAKGQQPTAEMQQQAEQFAKGFTQAIREDRKDLFTKDLLRSIVLILLSLGVIWAYTRNKLKPIPVITILLLLSSFDLLLVGRRYLNDEKFVEPAEFDNAFAMTTADQQIKQDKGYFRVLNLTVDPFNESSTAYHHNSIGGYHPAKLQIYQDLIENQISKNNMQVLNMLNTKYFIIQNPQTGSPVAQLNTEVYGPCWFAKTVRFVENGKEEMKALDSTNLKDTAIVQVKYKTIIGSLGTGDTTATITMIENRNDLIRYESNTVVPQFAVFSEIFYPRGWNVYIDGIKTNYVKTNYVLRGMTIPAGKHKIEFKFEPDSYKIGNAITLVSSLLAYFIVLGGLFMTWKKRKNHQTA